MKNVAGLALVFGIVLSLPLVGCAGPVSGEEQAEEASAAITVGYCNIKRQVGTATCRDLLDYGDYLSCQAVVEEEYEECLNSVDEPATEDSDNQTANPGWPGGRGGYHPGFEPPCVDCP